MRKLITRTIQKRIEKYLYSNKIIIIYGARQVGKTTLVRQIQRLQKKKSLYLNCDEPDIRMRLSNKTSTELKNFLGDNELVIIDEAQRVENIGLTLKLIIDNYPKIQIIATGSSSFDLANKINEPLTGRKYEFHLHPFSVKELNQNFLEQDRALEQQIIYGMYPEIINNPSEAKNNLKEITKSYLYKDVLQFINIKNSDILHKLLQALALQLGNEVSYNELANLLEIDKKTVQYYILILEQAFIIFRLNPFGRNLRTELRKKRKIYFYDTGVRNALLNNLNPLNLRNDIGALWENFLVSERLKNNQNHARYVNQYFWRTHQQQEIDYLEEENLKLSTFEFKWNNKKAGAKAPKAFRDAYPNTLFKVITQNNYQEFVGLI